MRVDELHRTTPQVLVGLTLNWVVPPSFVRFPPVQGVKIYHTNTRLSNIWQILEQPKQSQPNQVSNQPCYPVVVSYSLQQVAANDLAAGQPPRQSFPERIGVERRGGTFEWISEAQEENGEVGRGRRGGDHIESKEDKEDKGLIATARLRQLAVFVSSFQRSRRVRDINN